MAARNFYCLDERFIGAALGAEWSVADTSSAGSPTKAMAAGGYNMAFSSDAEVQNLCLHLGDVLSCDITKIREVEFRLKFSGATKDTATSLSFGVCSARNDNPDSTAVNAQFRMKAAGTGLTLECETDDGTTDTDDVAAGQSLSTSYKTCVISFATGLSDVRFFVDGQPVATSQTFSMAAATGGVQPFVQLQKTSDSNTDGVTIRRIIVRGVED